jgi:hypothetical protein
MTTEPNSKRELEQEIIGAKTHYQVAVVTAKVKAFLALQGSSED